jgi:hypothetical protein
MELSFSDRKTAKQQYNQSFARMKLFQACGQPSCQFMLLNTTSDIPFEIAIW